jgi:integrase
MYLRESGGASDQLTWDEAFESYRDYKCNRMRKQSFQSMCSCLDMSRRIFEARRADDGLPPGTTLVESLSLSSLEYLQNRLLDGAEGRYESRLATTVNSILGDVMAFARYCCDHDWISKVPPIKDLDEEEVMRGRPITGEEFDRMLASVPKVVGESATASWSFLLRVLWESGFRIADVLNFYWDDETKIHVRWATRNAKFSTLVIPSTQKNKKADEVPLLPGLQSLLEKVPESDRTGRVVKLAPIEYQMTVKKEGSFYASVDDLEKLIDEYSNLAIAAACKVSEQTVRNWLGQAGLERRGPITRYGERIPQETVQQLKKNARRRCSKSTDLSKDWVSRIVSSFGETAGIVVRQPDADRGIRIKYASAHDLRRSLAERLYNQGISAETLMVIMRHRDFATTRKFYAAKRRAESAAQEIHKILGQEKAESELVGGLVGGTEKAPQLTAEELLKLKRLLNSL